MKYAAASLPKKQPSAPKRAVFWLGIAVLFIFYFTLFPFDFFWPKTVSLTAVFRSFDTTFASHYALEDLPRNIILFLPLGLALGRLWQQGMRPLIGATLIGFGLSLAIELVQALFLVRFPSLADLVANTVGTTVGVLLWWRFSQRLRGWKTAVSHPPYRPALFAILLLAGLLTIAPRLRRAVEPTNWDASLPLLIGNEQTGDRPWAGEVRTLYAINRRLTTAEVERLLVGDAVAQVATNDLLAHYTPTPETAVIADQAGNLPNLIRRGQWLESEAPVSKWAETVAQTSSFTLGVILRSDELDQTGPARILSISDGPFARNLMLGQVGTDLVIRLRTPFTGENGRSPEFVIPNALADNQPHHLIVRYGKTADLLGTPHTLTVTIDNSQHSYQLPLTPAFTLFWRLPHAKAEQFRLSNHIMIYQLLYIGLFIWPIFILFRLAVRLPQAKPVLQTLSPTSTNSGTEV